MKRLSKKNITIVLFLAITVLSYDFVGPGVVYACGNTCGYGSGSTGGGDYIPQQRNSTGPIAQRSFLTKEQAGDIASYYMKGLNPGLKVGQIKDAGGFYDIEVLNDSNNVIQHLGVDKQTGRLILIK